jgi:hypothetical protein
LECGKLRLFEELALRSKPGKKKKSGKSRAIGISGLGRFFLFFPDLFF